MSFPSYLKGPPSGRDGLIEQWYRETAWRIPPIPMRIGVLEGSLAVDTYSVEAMGRLWKKRPGYRGLLPELFEVMGWAALCSGVVSFQLDFEVHLYLRMGLRGGTSVWLGEGEQDPYVRRGLSLLGFLRHTSWEEFRLGMRAKQKGKDFVFGG